MGQQLLLVTLTFTSRTHGRTYEVLLFDAETGLKKEACIDKVLQSKDRAIREKATTIPRWRV